MNKITLEEIQTERLSRDLVQRLDFKPFDLMD